MLLPHLRSNRLPAPYAERPDGGEEALAHVWLTADSESVLTVGRRSFCFLLLPLAWFGLFLWLFDPRMDAPEAVIVSITIVSLASGVVGYLHRRRIWAATLYAAVTAGLSAAAFFLVVFTLITVICWGAERCLT